MIRWLMAVLMWTIAGINAYFLVSHVTPISAALTVFTFLGGIYSAVWLAVEPNR